jgi:very-short-patch-repair endonuclease
MLKRKYFPELSDEDLRKLIYQMHITDEKSVNMMSKELGVARDTIYRWMAYFGIEPRNVSESARIRMKYMTSEERKQLASKAHEAVRGSKRVQTITERIHRASKASDAARMSKHEKTFAHMLIDADLYDFIFSYPLGIYNIDFAFPAQKVAIEVDGGNWHTTPRKMEQDSKKEAFLTSEGWTIYRWSNLDSSSSGTELIALLVKSVLG